MKLYNLIKRLTNALLYSLMGSFFIFIIFLNSKFNYHNIFLNTGSLLAILGIIFTLKKNYTIKKTFGSESDSEINENPEESIVATEKDKKHFFKKFYHTFIDIYYYSYELTLAGFILILYSII